MSNNKNLSKTIHKVFISTMVAIATLAAPQATASAQQLYTPQQLSSQFSIPTPQELAQQFGIQLPNSSSNQTPAPAPAPAPAPHIATAQEILNDTNAARAQHGLPPVAYSPELTTIAQDWANRVRNDGYISHRPQFWTHYPAYIKPGGENVLQAWTDYTSPQLVKLWMDSPGHRANILDPKAKSVGIGVAVAADGKLYSVQNFGR